jgi:hypothetical protein
LSGELVEDGKNLRDGSSAIVFNKVNEFLNDVPRSPQVLDSTNNGIFYSAYSVTGIWETNTKV